MNRRTGSSASASGNGRATGRAASRETGGRRADRAVAAERPASSARADEAAPSAYWRAKLDAPLFSGPQGRAVGEVATGTVVEEQAHFHDFFGDMWVAASASDESLVWVKAKPGDDQDEPQWEFVIDTDAPAGRQAIPTPPRNRAGGAASNSSFPFRYAFDVLASECPLKHTGPYVKLNWLTSPPQGGAAVRNWNEEYQYFVDRLVFNDRTRVATEDETANIRAEFERFTQTFVDAVDEAVTTIVKEMTLSQKERTIPAAGNGAVGVYLHQGIYFKVCIDTAGGAFGGDGNAMKIASTLRRTHDALAGVAPLSLITLPLMVVLTYCGYRVMAMAIPPVVGDSSSLVGGSESGGLARAANEAPFVQRLLKSLGEALRIKPHTITTSTGTATVFLSCDAQVHAGLDGRLYLFKVGRVLPPLAPPPNATKGAAAASNSGATLGNPYYPQTTSLLRRLRPEAAAAVNFSVNPDAFVPDAATAEDNDAAVAVTASVKNDIIPHIAAVLGFLEPCPDTLPTKECVRCQKEISTQELRFVVCRGEAECCAICMQCQIHVASQAGAATCESKMQELHDQLLAVCKCGSRPRPFKGFLMRPDVTSLFHAQGLNMRFLAYVYEQIPHSARRCTAHYLEVEMIARAAKHLVWKALRRTQSEEELRTVCANFFFALLRPDGDQAESFWSEELGPMIQSYFEVFVAFDTAALDPEACYRRVAELTGVELSPESVASFMTAAPFVQLAHPHSVMKWIHVPYICEKAGSHGMPLLSVYEEEAREFWEERRRNGWLWPAAPGRPTPVFLSPYL